jgi:adenosylcobinamide-phosphate synthase
MPLEYQIIAAFILDLVLGDPRWLPHPVRFMGRLAEAVEIPTRRVLSSPFVAGVVSAFIVMGATLLAVWVLLWTSSIIGNTARNIVSIFLIYTGLASKDLRDHSLAVRKALDSGNIQLARERVGMICGRDTDSLDQNSIIRASVESVAENTADGVTVPLFFAIVGGPFGIMLYKAVSTLDSTFGYKNERYLQFGWFSARLDDLFAFIPSRISGVLVSIAAWILSYDFTNSFCFFLRDRNKHPSPNAGQSEAAFAGALGIQLGGASYYKGEISIKPLLGENVDQIEPGLITRANSLMFVTSILALLVFMSLRMAFYSILYAVC